ncbi:MAG: phosphate regulon transcriptional regulatory protein PhoB [Halothiobacillaceae bacterium]|nr:MAG: phosphate regulon transcriptional regulatory protein PhoB [Halothiobacillaceae bacterium]
MLVKKILVVEDESAIREMVCWALRQSGFEVMETGDALQAKKRLAEQLPDLLLVDWMLPGMSGIDLARYVRKNDATKRLPLIMLTARGEESDKLLGLETGADDYVTKPFSTRELIARINALLRRSEATDGAEPLALGGVRLDPSSHIVMAQSSICEMGPTEFRLLHFFMTHAERVYSRSQLLDQVWGDHVYIEERTVDVHIRRLRKALSVGSCDGLIQTVRGAGYRFSARV